MRLGRSGSNFGEKVDYGITLYLRHTHNLRNETRVEKKTVEAGDRVCADQRMLGSDRVAPNRSTQCSRVGGLHVCRM